MSNLNFLGKVYRFNNDVDVVKILEEIFYKFVYILLDYQNKCINKKIRTFQRNNETKNMINPRMKTLALTVNINPSPIS